MTRTHIIPVGGKEPRHSASIHCHCQPLFQGGVLVTHHATDLREAQERQGRIDPNKFWVTIDEPVDEPQLTPKLLADTRAAAVKQASESGREITEFTCDNCRWASHCEFAFDGYNTNGDCLAEK